MIMDDRHAISQVCISYADIDVVDCAKGGCPLSSGLLLDGKLVSNVFNFCLVFRTHEFMPIELIDVVTHNRENS